MFISYMEALKADALEKKLNIPVVVITYGRFATLDPVRGLAHGFHEKARARSPSGSCTDGPLDAGNLISHRVWHDLDLTTPIVLRYR
jgi:hypothetical protein